MAHTFLVSDIADIEKCHCERGNTRAILVFFDDAPHAASYDLVFLDQTTRDIFCELVASIDRAISIKHGCGGVNTSHWVDDRAVRKCMKCGRDFSVAVRRHHCRLCGRVFCWACSDNSANLAELGFNKPVRVCGRCFDHIRDNRLQGLTVNGAAGHAGAGGVHNYNGQHAPHNVEKRLAAQQAAPAGSAAAPGAGGGSTAPATTVRKDSFSAVSSSSSSSAGTSASSSSSLAAAQSIHPHIDTKRPSDADEERIDALPSNPSPGPPDVERAASPFTIPTFAGGPNASPRGVTPRDGAFREGKRDRYGFIVGGEGTRGQDDRPYHRIHLAKQRKRWNQYLALHPSLDKTAELRRLVRKGIPPELRGSVWQVLSGSSERQAAHATGYYAELVRKAESAEHGSMAEIEKDLRRTFPDNHLYESEEGLAMLRRVLLAYSLHNPTVGYCQSMNFICALCLLFMDEEPAFWLLTVIVEELTCIDLGLPGSGQQMYYYQSDLAGVHIDQAVFGDLLAERLPRISAHFDKLSLPIGPFTVNWFLCLFVNTLPLETSLHVWDCMFSEGCKTLFRCALALMKVNEKTILATRDFEQVLLRSKNFHLAAAESSEFARVMFDDVWLGAFPMSRIDQLRKQHRAKIARELKERREALELNEEGVRVRPSQMVKPADKDNGDDHHDDDDDEDEEEDDQDADDAEERKREDGDKVADAASAGGAGDEAEGEGHEERDAHSTLHSSTILSSSLRAQLRLSEAALADPFAAFSPASTSPTNAADGDTAADNVDPKYAQRFKAFGDYIGPEHNADVIESYYTVEGGRDSRTEGRDSAAGDGEHEDVDDSASDDYITVEKPRALSSSQALPTSPPSSSAAAAQPSLPPRGKSASMSNIPPAVSGPHSRAMEARKRRTQSGAASPTGASQSLFGGWKSIFNRANNDKDAAAKVKSAKLADDEADDDSDDLPSPTPVSNYVKPALQAPDADDDEDEGKGPAPPRPVATSGPIFRRSPSDSPVNGVARPGVGALTKGLSASNSFHAQLPQGAGGKGAALYPRRTGGGSGGGSVE